MADTDTTTGTLPPTGVHDHGWAGSDNIDNVHAIYTATWRRSADSTAVQPLDPRVSTTIISLCGGLLGETLAFAMLGLPVSMICASEQSADVRASWNHVQHCCCTAKPLRASALPLNAAAFATRCTVCPPT